MPGRLIYTCMVICYRPYAPGFTTLIESDTFPKGLDEDVVRAISAKKKEPQWMLDFRLKVGFCCFMTAV